MPSPLAIDPSPRDYVASVELRERSGRGPASASGIASADAVEAWLLRDALGMRAVMELFEPLCWMLRAAGLPLDRATLNLGTLHPQLIGSSWLWQAGDGLCDEIRVHASTLVSDAYRRSPLFRAIEFGETVRCDAADPAAQAHYPLMAELAAGGVRDYIAMPLAPGVGVEPHRITVTLASRVPGGLAGANFTTLRRLFGLFAPHAARLMAERVAANIAAAYLGEVAGARVLEGSIQRGDGSAMQAVILISDLRGYSELSNTLPAAAVLALLNAQFECLVHAVEAHGGEVLKFVGDGLLAVFPVEGEDASDAARRGYQAALLGLEGIAGLNASDLTRPHRDENTQPIPRLRVGLALHLGEVFFGNVGAPERLDFTVIGSAVNTAARVEELTKTLNRPLLVTEPVAQIASAPVEPLGPQPIRGLAAPLPLFAPPNLRW